MTCDGNEATGSVTSLLFPKMSHTMTLLPLPALIADVGGTNLRFALVTAETVEPLPLGACRTSDFRTMTEAAATILAGHPGIAPKSAAFAIAAPVSGTRITITNADFTLDLKAVSDAFDLEAAMFLNDFEALAIALPALEANDVTVLHEGQTDPKGARVVIGPGTGLGAAILMNTVAGFVPVPGEAGHITFGPETEEDHTIWPHLERRDTCISPEVVISGPGLYNLYKGHAAAAGLEAALANQTEVSKAAEQGDKIALRAVMTFLRLLGRSAGDLALVPWASGGIYITGGMTNALKTFVGESDLVQALQNKSPHHHDMAKFPVYQITRSNTALFGMSVLLRGTLPVSLVTLDRLYQRKAH